MKKYFFTALCNEEERFSIIINADDYDNAYSDLRKTIKDAGANSKDYEFILKAVTYGET